MAEDCREFCPAFSECMNAFSDQKIHSIWEMLRPEQPDRRDKFNTLYRESYGCQGPIFIEYEKVTGIIFTKTKAEVVVECARFMIADPPVSE